MLKDKALCVVIAFPNTTSALAMEAACKRHNIPGRIIPVPNQITKACGFAWCAVAEEKETIEKFLLEEKINYKEIRILEI